VSCKRLARLIGKPLKPLDARRLDSSARAYASILDQLARANATERRRIMRESYSKCLPGSCASGATRAESAVARDGPKLRAWAEQTVIMEYPTTFVPCIIAVSHLEFPPHISKAEFHVASERSSGLSI
jgi:hypothetical protein